MGETPLSAAEPYAVDNPTLELLRLGDLSLGMVVRLGRSGDIARIARASGHDFLLIDIQHALFSIETVGHIAQAALGCGVTPLVRVRSCRDPDAPALLDCGVAGIVFPDVNSAEDARAAVGACKFAPIGERSLTATYVVFNHQAVPPRQLIERLNATTLVACMIESVAGLRNVEAIAAVAGVDVLLLGLTDLLASMGKPGALRDPAVAGAVARVAAAARAHGKFAGVGGEQDPARQAEFVRLGAQFFPTQSDIAFLLTGAARATAALRAESASARVP